ncbi:MAG: hypothetical protein ACP5JE_05150 [Thermoplasmata archaeon]
MLNEKEKRLFKEASATLKQLAVEYKNLQNKYAQLTKTLEAQKVAEKLITKGKAAPENKNELINKIAQDDIKFWDKLADLELSNSDLGMTTGVTMNKEKIAEELDPATKAILGY